MNYPQALESVSLKRRNKKVWKVMHQILKMVISKWCVWLLFFFFGIMFSNHPVIKKYCLNNFKKKSCQKPLSLITLILYSPSNTLGT